MKTVSDWDALDAQSGRLTRDEFRRQHAEEVGLTLEQYDRYLVVEACDDEVGWAAVPRTLVKREQREAGKA